MNTVLIALGVASEPIRIINTDTAVLIIMGYGYVPIRARREGMALSLETAGCDL